MKEVQQPLNSNVVDPLINYTIGMSVTFECEEAYKYSDETTQKTFLCVQNGVSGVWKAVDTSEWVGCLGMCLESDSII